MELKKDKMFKMLLSLFFVLLGNFIYAAATVLFVEPSGLIMGGVTGIGLFANHIAGIPVSTVVLIMNVTMLIAGFFLLGKGFAAKTVVSTFAFPIALAVCEKLLGGILLTEDLLLCAVFGGILIGASLGIVFRADASSGGMDIPPLVLNKYLRVPVAAGMWGFDVAILFMQAFSTSMEAILYGILLIIVYTVVLDKVLLFGTSKIEIKVISKKSDEIKKAIMEEMDRGVTGFHAKTGYMGKETELLMSILSTRELPKVEKLVRSIDPAAFVVVNKATEVYGRGFTEKKKYI